VTLSGLRDYIEGEGATVVGFAEVDEALPEEIAHLNRAISIGVERNLNADTLRQLRGLQKKTEKYLRDRGYKFLCIPPDSDRITDTFISKLYKLFSHKVAATCSGLGWIGKNGLLINPKYGPRLSLVTVLTDAPLQPDPPTEQSMCGECSLCVEMCPSGALSGREWSRDDPFPEIIDFSRCASHKGSTKRMSEKPNCGLCINVCPHGRRKPKEEVNAIVVTAEDK